jgi:transcriptional regulator GlxA family with amidase domain
MHRVVALALPRVVAFDLSIAAQVFGHRDEDLYDFSVCAAAPRLVATTTGFSVSIEQGLRALERADTVIVPGFEPLDVPAPRAVGSALRAVQARGGRLVSICTGAFALAAAGMLDGKRATTHWRAAELLARRYPAIDVQPDVLFVDEGRVLTSAGVAAGIDLCLHIVRCDHGASTANEIARRMVVAPHRQGGQAQFLQNPVPGEAAGGLEPTRAWALEHLNEPLTVSQLARKAGYSKRSFARRFLAETGTTPLQWLIAQRTLKARQLLEAGDLPIDVIARRCGFGSSASLRDHFRRATQTTPTEYRRAWGAVDAPEHSRELWQARRHVR